MSSCSQTARALREPLAGSAPWAQVWLAVEQPGPWGRAALEDSRFPPDVGRALTERTAGRPVRVQLIRRPGPHPDLGRSAPRTILIARTSGAPALWQGVVHDPRDVLDIDLEAVLGGMDPGIGRPVSGPVLLVCTNGRRDVCCAQSGRAAIAGLAATGHAVWETNHLGGHRFSPTFVRLPDGWVFGGPDATSMTTAAARGRSALTPEEQAAELAVLADAGLPAPIALPVTGGRGGRYVVGDRSVVVSHQTTVPDRPESCGKAAVPASSPVAVVER